MGSAKEVPRGKYTALSVYIKEESLKINDVNFHLKNLDKDEQITHKVSGTKEIIKSRNQ